MVFNEVGSGLKMQSNITKTMGLSKSHYKTVVGGDEHRPDKFIRTIAKFDLEPNVVKNKEMIPMF